MSEQQVLIVIDMQNGVFISPRYDRSGRAECINQLIDRAGRVIFIQHAEGEMSEGSEFWQVLPELHQPEGAISVTKTACDSFYRTTLESVLLELNATRFTVCGCATDYCVDTTIKVAASKGYAVTVASDAHTTGDRTHVTAQQLIGQHNEVWRELSVPGNPVTVKTTNEILADWQ